MDQAAINSIHAEALRELRGRGPINKPAETPQEAREELAAYVIHPAFYEASASALAYEFLRDVLRREPTDEVTLWHSTRKRLGRCWIVLMPCRCRCLGEDNRVGRSKEVG